ncbi:DNA polymerase I [Runella sp. MFBS21]|uniref:DNA polymerase I n=1 Tax=Runella sp. MFBS21 TaxID=3034018 RepID=UPI0023F7D6E2|nr:DNA polymerase I [Runella sp. MFBS21]MDF7818836.1 DNA polymerase I [Runella sp. MFBS21]
MKPDKKLFLLDAFALIYRAHFAFIKNPRITSKGLNTSAVFGFLNSLLEVLKDEKPTHLGVAFDTPKPTFRHIQFEAYKAQRQEQPEDITIAVPYIKRLLKALCIPILELDGYEADDVVGTLAKKAAREGFEVFMMTPDKDYGQLVEEHIYLYKPAALGKGVEIMGPQQICERWGIKDVSQVVDMLGLQGDASDNIPGIPGVGEKTAQKLVEEFGSVENLLANTDKLTGKLKEKVVDGADKAILSKELAKIDVNVPIEFDESDLLMCEPDRELLSELLDELEFRTLRKRLLGETDVSPTSAQVSAPASNGQLSLFGESTPTPTSEPSKPTPNKTAVTSFVESISTEKRTVANTFHRYHLIDTPELRKSLAYYLSLQDSFCFDTETTSIDAIDAELVGISFAYQSGEAFFVTVPADREAAQEVVEDFREVLENPKIEKIAQNLKYDLAVLQNYGVEIKGPLYDTMLAHYLIEPDKRHNMDILANSYLNYEPVAIEALIGKKGPKQLTMREVAIDKLVEYAAEDADITLQLKEKLHPLLIENQADKLFKGVEIPLVPVLADMEREGVRVDLQTLKEMSGVLDTDMKQVETEIFALAGEEFNISSPKQLGVVLFEKLKLIKNPKKTATGQYATGEDILSDLEAEHEIARKILDYRELQKLKSTYVDALPLLINNNTGRIHTSFNQAVAATGRLSSTNPNLQNIPIRTPRGREIRKAFVPKNEDFVILSADYSQIELRIMAAFSQDQTMLEAFNNGLDIHASTASKVFKVELAEVTSEMRRKAKMVNFGIIYGISAFGLAQRLGIPRGEASEIIKAYFQEFPSVKTFMDNAIHKARENKYVETILGRRRYLADIDSQNQTTRGFAERNAINAPIQGSAADMIKVAMINIHDFLKKENLESKMILQVHDELIFDAHRDEVELLSHKVNELMVNAIPLPVKMETGIGVGQNWLEAH